MTQREEAKAWLSFAQQHCLVLTGYGALVRYLFQLERRDDQVYQAVKLATEVLEIFKQILAKRGDE